MNFQSVIPLSLYIHLPWCIRKCPYCDFNSHAIGNKIPEEDYIAALRWDLEEQLPRIWGRRLISIFFGGGTPSLFSANAIEKMITAVNTYLPLSPDIEITLEANPGTIDTHHFKGYKSAGINRLSIGIQSLQNDKLKSLGRIHHRDHALRAIESAHSAGFTNFNLDLMHGLPNQSLTDAVTDLEDALRFKPPHLSWYQLTIEPQTFFHFQKPTLPDDDILNDIQVEGQKVILSRGLNHYEVSAYAKTNHECRHNKNYWEFGDYLGLGAGAHSKLTDFENQYIVRHSQVKNPKDYLHPEKKLTAQTRILRREEIIFEFMLNALRLTQGVSLELMSERTGYNKDELIPLLKTAKEKQLLVENPEVVASTELGQRFLNDLVGLFL